MHFRSVCFFFKNVIDYEQDSSSRIYLDLFGAIVVVDIRLLQEVLIGFYELDDLLL
jgi:hypothetical protein